MTRIQIGVDPDDLVACVSCGLCLPHCPTYRATQDESASPRGRLAMMRLADEGLEIDDRFIASMDSCIQCRACETACPAHVPYGRLMEATREALAEAAPGYAPRWKRAAFRVLGHHRLVLAGSTALAVAQRLRLVPKRLGVPPLALRRPPASTSGCSPAASWMPGSAPSTPPSSG